MSTAYLLVTHGSRDPRPRIALDRLTYLVSQSLGAFAAGMPEGKGSSFSPGRTIVLEQAPALVFHASLEAQDRPLHQQIVDLGKHLIGQGVGQLKILPLFLLRGVHVCEDLPREISQAQMVLGPRLPLSPLPTLGLSPLLAPWLASCFQQYQTGTRAQRVLLAHGSKRPGGNQAIAVMAEKVGARAAHWKGEVSLPEVLASLGRSGPVVILPYFLFAGGLTDAIKNQLPQWQQEYPHLELHLGEPLGPHPMLAQIIAQTLHQRQEKSPVS